MYRELSAFTQELRAIHDAELRRGTDREQLLAEALALAIESGQVLRPDLRLVVMSATIDGARFDGLGDGIDAGRVPAAHLGGVVRGVAITRRIGDDEDVAVGRVTLEHLGAQPPHRRGGLTLVEQHHGVETAQCVDGLEGDLSRTARSHADHRDVDGVPRTAARHPVGCRAAAVVLDYSNFLNPAASASASVANQISAIVAL